MFRRQCATYNADEIQVVEIGSPCPHTYAHNQLRQSCGNKCRCSQPTQDYYQGDAVGQGEPARERVQLGLDMRISVHGCCSSPPISPRRAGYLRRRNSACRTMGSGGQCDHARTGERGREGWETVEDSGRDARIVMSSNWRHMSTSPVARFSPTGAGVSPARAFLVWARLRSARSVSGLDKGEVASHYRDRMRR